MRSRTALSCALAAIPALLVAPPPATAKSVTSPQVTVTSAPKTAVEGDRLSFRVKISGAQKAKKVQLQERVENIWGTYEWVGVHKHKVRGKARHEFKVTADGIDTEKYRAVVTDMKGHKTASRPVTVKVWRWIPLTSYRSYYEAGGVLLSPYTAFAMNGKAYMGWKTYGGTKSWESRYTPGRNCRDFRADLGVLDSSQDGSSGSISLLTDDGDLIFTSDSLTPGMVQPVDIALNKPYRFWVQATDTSPEGLWAYPAMGDPAFLCRGL